jgi:hypothetical protein
MTNRQDTGSQRLTIQPYDIGAAQLLYGTHASQIYYWNLVREANDWPETTAAQRTRKRDRLHYLYSVLNGFWYSIFTAERTCW